MALTDEFEDVLKQNEQAVIARWGEHPDLNKSPLLTAEDLVAWLRRLRKSVELWTKQGGRQGYLEHVVKFVA